MYLTCLIFSIILILIFNKLDKKVSEKLEWDITDEDAIIWIEYQEGRRRIYKILCLLAFIPLLNMFILWMTIIATIIFLGLLISEMNFWNKLF